MLEQVSTSVKFLAFYTASKQGSTGLTVTVDVYDPAGTKIVDASAATELAGGLYTYTLSSSNSSAGEYVAIFKTADANVDAQHVPSLWSLGRAGVENLDATISSRLADADYTAPTAAPTVVDIRTELATELANLDATVSSRLAAANYTAPTAAPTVADIRAELATELANLDAAVSTRATPADIPASDITAIKAKTDLLNTDRLANVATTNIVGTLLAQANS
jgi:hypothetical protein